MQTAFISVGDFAVTLDTIDEIALDDMSPEQIDLVVTRIVTDSDSVPVAAFNSSI